MCDDGEDKLAFTTLPSFAFYQVTGMKRGIFFFICLFYCLNNNLPLDAEISQDLYFASNILSFIAVLKAIFVIIVICLDLKLMRTFFELEFSHQEH